MARILVIEDNAINLELMSYTLRAWGHDPVLAQDAEVGLELARRERPELIICDIKLPGRDGYSVARELKADPLLRQVPLVALTAFAMVGDHSLALAAGFDAHFAKPIDPARFMEALQPLLRMAGAQAAASPPAAPDPALMPAAAGALSPLLHAPRPRCALLTVDDGPINLEYKHSLFEPAGYTVLDADRPSRALALMRVQPVDLVLSDVEMPEGGGFELLRTVRADAGLRDLPFIFLTSTARDEASVARGLALGADAYLVRPLEAALLLAQIRRALVGPG